MRIYQLAKTLNVESKQLLDYCAELGFDIKNQLSALTPEQGEALIQRSKQGAKSSVSAATAPAPVIKSTLSNKVQTLSARPTGRPVEAPAEPVPPPPTPTVAPTPAAPAQVPAAAPTPPRPSATPTVAANAAAPAVRPAAAGTTTPPAPRAPANAAGAPMRNLGNTGAPPRADGGSPPTRVRTPLLPRGRSGSGYGVVTRNSQAKPPPSLRTPAPPATPKPSGGVTKIANIPQHLMKGDRPITAKDVLDAQRTPPLGGAVAPV